MMDVEDSVILSLNEVEAKNPVLPKGEGLYSENEILRLL